MFHCAMLAFIRDLFVTSYKWLNPVTVDALGVRNGPAMAWCWHHLCRPAQQSCACSTARIGLEACHCLHSGLPMKYTYIISNGIPGSTYLGATSAELAPTSEWVTQLSTLACKIFVKYHCLKRAPLDPLLTLLRPSSCTHIHPIFPEPPLLCMKSPRADIVHSSYVYIPNTSQLHPNCLGR